MKATSYRKRKIKRSIAIEKITNEETGSEFMVAPLNLQAWLLSGKMPQSLVAKALPAWEAQGVYNPERAGEQFVSSLSEQDVRDAVNFATDSVREVCFLPAIVAPYTSPEDAAKIVREKYSLLPLSEFEKLELVFKRPKEKETLDTEIEYEDFRPVSVDEMTDEEITECYLYAGEVEDKDFEFLMSYIKEGKGNKTAEAVTSFRAGQTNGLTDVRADSRKDEDAVSQEAKA